MGWGSDSVVLHDYPFYKISLFRYFLSIYKYSSIKKKIRGTSEFRKTQTLKKNLKKSGNAKSGLKKGT